MLPFTHRTELCSVSVMEYLNRKRTHTSKSRVVSGPKIDGIIREFGDYPLEYGAIEVSPSHKGQFATKWITDRTKLLKVLGHMVRRLYWYFSSRGGKPEDAEKIQVVGMLCSGKLHGSLQHFHCVLIFGRRLQDSGNLHVYERPCVPCQCLQLGLHRKCSQ